MATEKQILANRRNAQKSTGPKTPEGFAAVRFNGLKHGLTAGGLTLPDEDEDEFVALLDSIETEHQPATPTETALVRRIAMAAWRLTRLYRMEAGFFTVRQMDLQDKFDDYTALDPGDRLAIIVRDDSLNAGALLNISVYESRLERSMDKGVRELQRLRSVRCGQMKNQSQFTRASPDPGPAPADKPPTQPDSAADMPAVSK
jgi:hypothetical protein